MRPIYPLFAALLLPACAVEDVDVGQTTQDLDPLIQLQILGPTNGGNTVFYDRLPPAFAGGPRQARISIAMNLVNSRPTGIAVNKITFNGTTLVPAFVVPANTTFPLQQDQSSGMSYATMVLNEPVPATATLDVIELGGTNNPVASQTVTLSPYTNDAGPMAWMGKSRDLAQNETWGASSAHANNSGGLQSFALDVGVLGWDTTNKTYQEFYGTTPPGTGAPGTRWHIYGRPMYAMTGGTVCFAVNDQGEKTGVGDNTVYTSAANGGISFGGGDQIFINTGTEIAVYAHLQPGSIPPELMTVGATVARGQYIGKAGFSGATDHPAPHVHVKQVPANGAPKAGYFMNNCDAGLPRPMGYTGPSEVVESEAITSAKAGSTPAFSALSNQTAPDPYGLIYPSGSYSFCAGCTDTQEYIATENVGSSIDVRVKVAGWSTFVAKRNEMSADGFRLTQLETFKENNLQQFLGIFTYGTSPADAADSQDLQDFTDFSALSTTAINMANNNGRHLVDVATYLDSSSVRHYAAVFRPGTGQIRAVSVAGSTNFSNLWSAMAGLGYRLTDVETYGLSNGDRDYIGIFEEGTYGYAMWGGVGWANFVNEVNALDGQGLRLVDVESWPSGTDRVYMGVFRQGTTGLLPMRVKSYDSYVQLIEGNNPLGVRSVDVHVEHD